jgi:hypothetical protein
VGADNTGCVAADEVEVAAAPPPQAVSKNDSPMRSEIEKRIPLMVILSIFHYQ